MTLRDSALHKQLATHIHQNGGVTEPCRLLLAYAGLTLSDAFKNAYRHYKMIKLLCAFSLN